MRPGDDGGDVLTHAVAGHDGRARRPTTATARPARTRRRTAAGWAWTMPPATAPSAGVVEQHGRERLVRQRPEQLGAAVDRLTEDGCRAVQLPAHPGVLRAVAGEQERHLGRTGADRPPPSTTASSASASSAPASHAESARRRPGRVGGDDGQSMGQVAAPGVGRAGDVGERRRRRRRPGGRRIRSASSTRARSVRALKRQQVRPSHLVVHRRRRRLLQHDVGVGAAEPERADAADASAARAPSTRCASSGRRSAARPTGCSGLGSVEVQRRRHLAVLQAQHDLDQPGDAGRRLEVADVGLDRADQQPVRPVAAGAEGGAQRLGLDRVAERRARAVRLDVADVGGRDARRRRARRG